MLPKKISVPLFELVLLSLFGNILTTSKSTKTYLSVKTDLLILSKISNVPLLFFILNGILSAIGYRIFSDKIDRF